MAIKDWPEQQRPREKLLDAGSQQLSDAELLAIFLRTGCHGLSAVDLAHQLLDEFGSLRALFEADQKQFCSMRGLGQAKYVQLQAVLEMSRRYLESSLKRGDAFTDSQATRNYLKQQLRPYPHEVFACLFLDNQHCLIEFKELFHGTIDSANVYPREVVKQALLCNASAVVAAHNHPSGIAEPSRADIDITHTLLDALALVDIRLLDHIIVGDAATTSLAEQGQLYR